MSLIDNKNSIKNIRERNYLARDFDGFRTVILDYAKRYYPDRIQDFSEASMGGLFLDMAAYVGDNLSFYLDHLYSELNSDTAVETSNIQNAIRNAGVIITGASPSIVDIDFYVEIPVLQDGTLMPNPKLLPTVIAGTTVKADNGVIFTLVEDINFSTVDIETGVVSVDKDVVITNGSRSNITNTVITKILKKSGIFSSGTQITESFPIGNFVQFRTITLSQTNVTQIINVTDGYGNTYYEVDNLTNDVVYRNVLNTSGQDNSLVKDSLKVIAAPYRFVKNMSLSDRLTTLMFGGGTAENFENDIIPDPSEFAIALPYSQTFSTTSINPQKLLQTSTLGVSSSNTAIVITYRAGGGSSHNVPARTIRNISNINIVFPENPSPALQLQIKNGMEANNPLPAKGGDDAPSSDMLVSLIPTVKNSQNRIVTKEDMLARIYTMPSNFGRVFRAAVAKNPNNPLAAQLFVISKDENDELIVSPDTLKTNLKRYLNSYRMISDSIDLLDASIINMELFFQIVVDPSYNKTSLLQSIISDIQSQFKVQNFHINQPIVMSDVMSTIFTKNGVISVDIIKFNNLSGTVKNKFYSPITFDVNVNTKNKIIYPPVGGIFEIKYPDINIIGKAITNA
jgi:hypothetical protein